MTPPYSSLRRLLAIITPVAASLVACAPTPPSDGRAAPPPVAAPSASTAPSDVQLFFDEGSSALTPASNEKLDQAARLYREGSPLVMFVAGHADKNGSEYQNLMLSGERARSAKQGLVARGIPSERLQLQALGTSPPSDPKATLPENNKRVVITWR